MNWQLVFRFVKRELRSTEARILVLALAVAVGSVGAVGMFADRVKAAFANQANVLLGADAMISADRPLSDDFAAQAAAFDLRTTQSTRFGSMVSKSSGSGDAALSDVKAISAPYPLRGVIEVRSADGASSGARGARVALRDVPKAGEAFVDERLASRLDIKVGDTINLGKNTPRVSQIFVEEPEIAGNFLSASPKVLMSIADLASSELVGPGSRASYRIQVAGPRAEAFTAAIKPKLGPGQRLETVRELRPEVRQTLERSEQFLGLAASFAVFLAVVAIVLALRRYLKRELDTATLFRTLGAGRRQTLLHFVGQFAVLSLIACAMGVALAYAAQAGLAFAVRGLFASELPAAGYAPLVKSFLTGLVLLLGFALPPLVALASTPPVRALRRDLPAPTGGGVIASVLGIAAVLGVVLLQAQDLRTGMIFVGGIVALVGSATLLAAAVLWGVRRVTRSRSKKPWQLGLANLDRRRLSTSIQIACLGLGVMTLITVGFVRADLFSAWQKSLPPDAPNRFLVNIQPEQIDTLSGLLKERGQAAKFYPMVRGRLVAVNDKAVSSKDFVEDRAKRLVDREFNLSSSESLPPGNALVAGQYGGDTESGTLSLEDGIAKTLNVSLGDRLTFDVAGEKVALKVTSLRKVDWDSFRVNFFALIPKSTIEPLPKSYITAFHLPANDGKTLPMLVNAAPNVLAIDVSEIMERVRSIVEQVAKALEFVFLFTLVAGLLTLYTAVVSTQDERRYDTAVVRTLGGTRSQVRSALIAEFSLLGLAAGVLGVLGAVALTWTLATRIIKVEFIPSPGVWLLGLLAATLCTLAAGWLGTRSVLSTSPIQVLRENA
ncbi:MAG: FtsX-like permease family protein [Betaproteobacteria bacterium]|nr:MAG: FtsX-like permease family protein [Betaproteobacteria bacterium]